MTDIFENPYLKEQIITYIGNKRLLLPNINRHIENIKAETGKDRLVSADLFSGSGIVARLLKLHSSLVIANDLEKYSRILNECYLSNKEEFSEEDYDRQYALLEESLKNPQRGIISELYSPENDGDIKEGERVFYTSKNARIIDTVRNAVCGMDEHLQKFFLAPLLYEASVHTNTSGVFKGFYKDSKTGIGKFGGNGENALTRILGDITVRKPVLSPVSSEYLVFQKDAADLTKELKGLDIAYIDPPYNQHPYGSNYFMLNVIAENVFPEKISAVSGIPEGWNRSDYNKKKLVHSALEDLISDLDAEYLIISYNSEGFVAFDEMTDLLSKYGRLTTEEIYYNTFRGCRNLHARPKHVSEYLFVLKKGGR